MNSGLSWKMALAFGVMSLISTIAVLGGSGEVLAQEPQPAANPSTSGDSAAFKQRYSQLNAMFYRRFLDTCKVDEDARQGYPQFRAKIADGLKPNSMSSGKSLYSVFNPINGDISVTENYLTQLGYKVSIRLATDSNYCQYALSDATALDWQVFIKRARLSKASANNFRGRNMTGLTTTANLVETNQEGTEFRYYNMLKSGTEPYWLRISRGSYGNMTYVNMAWVQMDLSGSKRVVQGAAPQQASATGQSPAQVNANSNDGLQKRWGEMQPFFHNFQLNCMRSSANGYRRFRAAIERGLRFGSQEAGYAIYSVYQPINGDISLKHGVLSKGDQAVTIRLARDNRSCQYAISNPGPMDWLLIDRIAKWQKQTAIRARGNGVSGLSTGPDMAGTDRSGTELRYFNMLNPGRYPYWLRISQGSHENVPYVNMRWVQMDLTGESPIEKRAN